MEKLIIGIIIITFLYKVYQNFKKEMQKAADRTKQVTEALKAKPQPQAVPSQNNKTTYDKALAQKQATEVVIDNNKQDYFKEKAKAKKDRDTVTDSRRKPVLDYYNPETPAAEVIENRRIHQPHKHAFEFPKKPLHLAANFNMKQALIYDAILNRPKY